MKNNRISTVNLCWALGLRYDEVSAVKRVASEERMKIRAYFSQAVLKNEVDPKYLTRAASSIPALLWVLRESGWEPSAKYHPEGWGMEAREYFDYEYLGFDPGAGNYYDAEDILGLGIPNLRVPVVVGPEKGMVIKDGSFSDILDILSHEFSADTLNRVGEIVCEASNRVSSSLDPQFRYDVRFDTTLSGVVRNVGVGLSMTLLSKEYVNSVAGGIVVPGTPERERGLINLTKGLVESSLDFVYIP